MFHITVDWSTTTGGAHTLLGYYIYRGCDDQDPVCVNSDILPATTSSFVDTSALKSGKIYTYYVVAYYGSGIIKYTTMNPKSSTVVWGIPQLSNDAVDSIQNGDNMYVGTLMGSGSIGTIIAILALGASAASIGLIINSKKKKSSDESEEET